MSDKDKEIKELKERLERLESKPDKVVVNNIEKKSGIGCGTIFLWGIGIWIVLAILYYGGFYS